MNTDFRKHIRKSLNNPTLQGALDNNAERRSTKRLNALESLPDWKDRRQQAHAIRAEIIEHLDQYLDQFIAEAGCLMHITGGLHRQKKKQRVMHIAEILNHH